ncbi:MAG: T9SS type A sorting domain-containing protein [Sporocytophaga sp.]|uniref:Ig-like domain-containing protein n=1 Tax=Sporocytophaga sp. TaxID=2231183 RepID=UPI001AFD0B29|nr:Ig-like domain-containing protein [Sporocytophaga sp.]MBO9702356.1 T9SS type A sorting domain-containing protein [Sporocytophaga sp.]
MKKTILLLCCTMLWHLSMAQQPIIPSVIKGLTIMLEYQDYKFAETEQEISDLMNKQNYTLNGNLGSVRDYFYAQTNGKVTITSTVVRVSFPEKYEYYHSNGRQYVEDAIDWINEHYPEGFQGLTEDPMDGKLLHMNFLERGPDFPGVTNGVNREMYLKNNTNGRIRVGQGNISGAPAGYPIAVGTICHEMGHSVMSWPDYYHPAFCNFGNYDLMSSAQTEHGPMPINAALRYQRGWVDNVIEIPGTVTQNYTLTANDYSTVHIYKNPNNSKEYLVFHALKVGGYYQSPVAGQVMPEGLAIWYVDEDRGSDAPVPGNYDFIVRLVQADNLDEMSDYDSPDQNGDIYDLYGNFNKSFPGVHPLRWKDGGEIGINITNISNPGATMSFTVNARPNTIVASSDIYGTISPKGTLSVANGQSKTFTFTPNPGYEVDAVKENGVAVTVPNPYAMPAVTGTKKISVSFKRKSPVPALLAPWQKASIGGNSLDFVATTNNSIYLETYGNTVTNSIDTFTYAYQSINGNGTFIVHLANFNTIKDSRAGLMLRESLDANSEYWAVAKYTQGGAIAMHRSAAGAVTEDNPSGLKDLEIYNLYNWLRIVRNGDYIESSCSKDGVTWKTLGSKIYPMSSQLYIGVFAVSPNKSYPKTATFDNISFSTLPSPSVTITSPVNKATFASGTITINATASPGNANNSVLKVDFYNGTTLIGTDNTAPYSLVWTNAPLGLQTIVAKTTDTDLLVATSKKVNVDILCPFTDQKITTGSVIGTAGSYGGTIYTRDKVFDGDVTNYFDSPTDEGWVGLALPSRYKITGIRFFPRKDFTSRMTGGKFQGSNTADFSSGVIDLYTIATEPAYNWNCIDIPGGAVFKYVRYVCAGGGFTNVAEIEFYGVSANVIPTVAFAAPASGASFDAPATINIVANATDVDGTIAKVDFYNGSAYLGSDDIAPYTYTLSNLAAGSYDLIAYSKDNVGSVSAPVVIPVSVVVSTADISGPSCGSNNTTLTFELSAAKKANATSYNWWFTGSAQNVASVSGSPYKMTMISGSSFSAGNVCVGVNYSASPWYASYCKAITLCSARIGEEDMETGTMNESFIYPNPSADIFNIDLNSNAQSVSIVNNMGVTVYQKSDLKQGEKISVGTDFEAGIYLISIRYNNAKQEMLKMVKVK